MDQVLRVDAVHPEPEVIEAASAVLARGGLVAFPTETVYGLGARGLHGAEVARIFAAKQRPSGHPLILHVDGPAMAKRLASTWNPRAERFAEAFWPGALTLVVPRAADVPDEATAGLGSVGLRMPRHPVAIALISAVSEPLAAPSANAHMHVSPTSAAHVVQSLGDRVDLVLDGGPCAHGIESTVLSIADPSQPPRVLRPGAVSVEALRRIDPSVVYEPIAVTQADASRASPGMASKHYAPRARVVLASAGGEAVRVARELATGGAVVGLLAWSAATKESDTRDLRGPTKLLPSDAEGYARALFAALYDFDASAVEILVIERVPDDPSWVAVLDRITRAAAAG